MWHKTKYPEAMKKLPEEVRNKAITIANARLEEDVDGNRKTLIDTSIRLAKAWAENKNKKAAPTVAKKKAKAPAKKKAKATAAKKATKATKPTKRTRKPAKKDMAGEMLNHGPDLHLIPSHPKVEPESNVTNKKVQQHYDHREQIAMQQEQKRAREVVALRVKAGKRFHNPRQG